jgi:hypothetical protein
MIPKLENKIDEQKKNHEADKKGANPINPIPYTL